MGFILIEIHVMQSFLGKTRPVFKAVSSYQNESSIHQVHQLVSEESVMNPIYVYCLKDSCNRELHVQGSGPQVRIGILAYVVWRSENFSSYQ